MVVPLADDEREWLNALVAVRHPRGTAGSWVSCFSAAVRDARPATGRHIETGEVIVDDPTTTGNWLGALGYMALLDHIGLCYQPEVFPRTTPETSGFIKALTYFAPELPEPEIMTLWALRNSFAHNYSLANPRPTAKHRYRFLLSAEAGQPLVVPALVPWDGTIRLKTRHETVVNLRAFGDLAERIVAEVQRLAASNQLAVVLAGGIEGLKGQFTIQLRNYERPEEWTSDRST